VDVLDVSVWPATVKGTVAVGSYPEQLILCGGLVIVTNSGDNTVQGINPTSMATVAEVNLGAGESPELMACDGVHTVYVTDWSGGDIKSIDVSQKSWAVGHTLAIPAADTASLPDGGLAAPSPFGMAFAATGGGSEVLVSLENLDLANGYAPAGPATVLVIDSQLSGVQSTINPGAACQNGQFLSLSPSGATLIETCTGAFYTGSTTGTLAPIALPGGTVGPLASVPLGNPGPTTYLKNGLVAVGDQASGQLAIWNPADGGVLVLDPCTSPLPDGGNVTSEIVGAVVAAP
jgi:DNA-binding beta-propeller fold protein YncE